MLGHEGPEPTRIAPIGVVTFEIYHRLLGAFTLAYAPARRWRSMTHLPTRLLVPRKSDKREINGQPRRDRKER